jgi:hypothetical protein
VNVLHDAQFVKYIEKNSDEEEGIAFLKISCWGAQPVQLLAVDGKNYSEQKKFYPFFTCLVVRYLYMEC